MGNNVDFQFSFGGVGYSTRNGCFIDPSDFRDTFRSMSYRPSYSYSSSSYTRSRINEEEEEEERLRRIRDQQRKEEEERKRREEEMNRKMKEKFEKSKEELLATSKREIELILNQKLENYCFAKLNSFSNDQKYKQFFNEVINLSQIKDVNELKVEDIYSKLLEQLNEKKKYKILILGKTGVGKSTLVNGIFNENLSEEKFGEVCTNNEVPQPYTHETNPSLVLYDTRGVEISGENGLQNLLKKISDFIHSKNSDKEEMVDCIWYCIKGARIEDDELEFLEKLTEIYYGNFPFIIVYTQSIDEDDENTMKNVVEEMMDDKINFIPVLAKKLTLKNKTVIEKFGLEKLVEITKKEIDKNKKNLDFVVYMEKLNKEINDLVEKNYIGMNENKVGTLFNNYILDYIKEIKENGTDEIIEEKLTEIINKLKEKENSIKGEFGNSGNMSNNYSQIKREMKGELRTFLQNTGTARNTELILRNKIYEILKEDVAKNLKENFEEKKRIFISNRKNN